MATQSIDRGLLGAHTLGASESRARLWTGRVLTTLPVLFLLMDGAMKVANVAPVAASMTQLGYRPALAPALGVVLLACVLLYAVPRTAVLGAILLTGYLGGAVATHVRVDNPLFSHVLFPVYVALMLWGGIYLRDARLRALIPLRSDR
ncbi:MAG: DoxX family protein [Gemmatimonadetes bacterium]|nr:DoxX family protein [Gemmatimonadota bacterium]